MGCIGSAGHFTGAKKAFVQLEGEPKSTKTFRHYVTLRATPELRRIYFSRNLPAIREYIAEWLFNNRPPVRPPFNIADLPSQTMNMGVSALASEPSPAEIGKPNPDAQRFNDELVVVLNVEPEALESIRDAIARDKGKLFLGVGVDVAFATADHWCPSEAADPTFADRSAAERLLGVDYLKSRKATSGRGVNVVIVDQGLYRDRLGDRYGGGWPANGKQPGTTISPGPNTTYPSHGMKIAHNVLSVAPEATLFDLPVVPPRITNIPAYLSGAQCAYDAMLAGIAQYRKNGRYRGPWIAVNAWSIYDTSTDPAGNYTEDPDHPFNKLVKKAVAQDIDVVFAAGNCGQFCPDGRCGPTDQEPGRSIWGANSLDQVLTVGAVRADTMWLGSSSQGPGQPRLGSEKPDLCAPSQFCEDDDTHILNTGTSAACALTAGVVAALRTTWDAEVIPPGRLKELLTDTARKTDGPGWNNRLGHGILDAKAAYDAAPGYVTRVTTT